MSDHDELLRTIEAIHASGLEVESESGALAAVSRLLGATGATMEVIDKSARRHVGMWSFGIPTAHKNDYIEQFAATSPRIPFGFRQRAGDISWDYLILDEAALRRNAYYSDFLPRIGLRYFLAAILTHTLEEMAVFCVHRSRKEDHVSEREIALMRHLVPHLQLAHDMATRLKIAESRTGAFERALEWLTDGVALLRKDGHLLFANEAFGAIARRQDGLRIVKGTVVLDSPDAQARYDAAFAAILRLRDRHLDALQHMDFPAPRKTGLPAYVVSVRPLMSGPADEPRHEAVAIVLVRDPLGRNPAGARMLRDLFGFTEAEANLAHALQAGVLLEDYASDNAITLNTVYTHLRRIKEKTGCRRIARLARMLRELELPLRLN